MGSYRELNVITYKADVDVAGNYTYVTDGSTLHIIDVSSPSEPVEVGIYQPPGGVFRIEVVGSYAYITGYGSGFRIIDVSDPANPVEVGSMDIPWTIDVAVVDHYAYVTDISTLRIIDVSIPSEPNEIGSIIYCPGGCPDNGLTVVGNYAYITDGEAGLRIIDVNDPIEPTEVGFYYTPDSSAKDVAVSGNYAYMVHSSYSLFSLRTIDVSRPEAPREVGFYITPSYAWSVVADGEYAYVSTSEAGLLILEYKPPLLVHLPLVFRNH